MCWVNTCGSSHTRSGSECDFYMDDYVASFYSIGHGQGHLEEAGGLIVALWPPESDARSIHVTGDFSPFH